MKTIPCQRLMEQIIAENYAEPVARLFRKSRRETVCAAKLGSALSIVN